MRKNKIQRFTYPRDQNSICLKQAQEMGYFKLGSTVILLFADDKRVGLQQNLSRGDKIQFGHALGSILGKL